jgi:hypothetical protein
MTRALACEVGNAAILAPGAAILKSRGTSRKVAACRVTLSGSETHRIRKMGLALRDPFYALLAYLMLAGAMISTILIILGLVADGIKLADVFLTKEQKDRIDLLVTRLWFVLAVAQKYSLTEWLLNRRRRFWFLAASALGATALFLYSTGSEVDVIRPPTIVFIIVSAVGFLTGLSLGKGILDWQLVDRGVLRNSLRLILSLLASSFVVFFLFLEYVFWATWHENFFEDWLSFDDAFWRGAYILFFNTIQTAYIYLLAATVPLVAVLIAQGLIFCFELFCRKLIEFPKGPVIALGTLAAAIGGIIKVFVAKG